jgi:alpha-glucosidase
VKVKVERSNKIFRIIINEPKPIVKYEFKGEEVDVENLFNMEISEVKEGLEIKIPLKLETHILGLGEKAFEIDRRRVKLVMWNTDAYGYKWGTDPLYVSIPFLIKVDDRIVGYFFNSTSRLEFDIGYTNYDKLIVKIPEEDAEIFVFLGENIQEILELYTDLTGKPFLLPEWALGYQISRYSYFPQEYVEEIVEKHLKEGIKVSAIYLDIDYMSKYKIFTWDNRRFPNPKDLVRKLHSLGVKVITIIDPCVRLDQSYELFKDGLGNYVENEDGTLYVDYLWPGLCVFPDFLNARTREWWRNLIRRWVSDYEIDGIWLDMNEPSVLGKRNFNLKAVHNLDDGRRVFHERVHNAYSLFEAMATKDEVDFVLSRAGYAGIQRYAAIWTGDNTSSWEDLSLQIALILGLSISGVPYVGCDIGGFAGRINDYLLLYRYFQVALFFPIFRNHKSKDGSDQEIFLLPDYWKERIKDVIKLRYKFLPYLYALAKESHEKGHPIIRPLAYHYSKDENSFKINDEYLVGEYLLYAPQLYRETKRLVYLPEGKWLNWWTNEEYEGMEWIETNNEFPIFIRYNSIIPTIEICNGNNLVLHIYGESSEITLGDGTKVVYNNGKVISNLKDFKIIKRPENNDELCP